MADIIKEDIRPCITKDGETIAEAYNGIELTSIIEIVFIEPIDTQKFNALISYHFPGVQFVTKAYKNNEENRKHAEAFVDYYLGKHD